MRLYIVFEYVDGTVLDFLESQRTKQIEYPIAREITWQLLRALEFIHQVFKIKNSNCNERKQKILFEFENYYS